MNIEGTYTLQAAREEVWQHLMDQEVLRAVIPGVESVEAVDAHTYDIIVAMRYASLTGSYRARLTISEQHYPSSYHLNVEAEGSQGSFSGSGTVRLDTREHTTIVAYKGTLTTSKANTLLPQPIIKGAAKLFVQQFFLALAERLRREQRFHAPVMAGALDGASGTQTTFSTPEQPRETPPNNPEPSSLHPTMYTRIVQILHLGAQDPKQQMRWEQRLRRISFISSLLFLVWVGTRLPRRK